MAQNVSGCPFGFMQSEKPAKESGQDWPDFYETLLILLIPSRKLPRFESQDQQSMKRFDQDHEQEHESRTLQRSGLKVDTLLTPDL